MRADALARVVEEAQSAALLVQGWPDVLSRLADAGNAAGALILREVGTEPVEIVASPSLTEPVADYLAGRRPPDSRQERVRVGPRSGFVVDDDHFTRDEIAKDPFYQEFLRPRGFGWHACAWLDGPETHPLVLSLKRPFCLGHYRRDEVALLDAVLPELRRSAQFRRTLADNLAIGAERLLSQQGKAVFMVAPDGSVHSCGDRAEHLVGHSIRLLHGRLAACRPSEQASLDAALAHSARPPCRSSAVMLTAADGLGRSVLRLMPVAGQARDIFSAVSAFGVLTPVGEHDEPTSDAIALLRMLFGLTRAEARLAGYVGVGWPLAKSASRLGIGVGTARNHLKAVLAKTGTARQAELVRLVAQLS